MMLEHYHDKQPAAEKLQEFMANKAATDMLMETNKNALNDGSGSGTKPRKSMRRVILCFVALYIATAVLTTLFVKYDYSERFDSNRKVVTEYLALSDMEDETDYVNSIYDLSATRDEYQYISAALYDAEGNLVVKTTPHIRLEVDNMIYRFELDDYFVKPEIETLLLYAKDTSKEYIVEAKISMESETLVSMQFTKSSLASGTVTVWDWTNSEEELLQEETTTFRKETKLRNILQIPYTDSERYEEWLGKSYLHSFAEKIDVDTKGSKIKAEESRVETIQKVERDEETYWISVRTTMSSMQATLWTLLPVYIAGLILTAVGIFFTIHEFRKYKTK